MKDYVYEFTYLLSAMHTLEYDFSSKSISCYYSFNYTFYMIEKVQYNCFFPNR